MSFELSLGQLLRHPNTLARDLPEPYGELAVVQVVKLDQELVELTGKMFALLQPRANLLVRCEVDGVRLDDDLSSLRDCFFGTFSGVEGLDLLERDDSGVEFGLWDGVVGLVEEDSLVVRRVDVAEDAAG